MCACQRMYGETIETRISLEKYCMLSSKRLQKILHDDLCVELVTMGDLKFIEYAPIGIFFLIQVVGRDISRQRNF